MPSVPGRPCTNHNIRAYIYGSEQHGRPHWHLVAKEWSASFDIETCELLAGDPPPKELREAREWWALNIHELRRVWRETHGPED
jgi:hypothetical protein